MPDISKLPELAELFGTTIDALLGRHSPLIDKQGRRCDACRAALIALSPPFNHPLMDKIRPLWYHHLTPVNNTEELFYDDIQL